MQNNDFKSNNDCRFQYTKISHKTYTCIWQKKAWRKKIYARKRRGKDSKIHYLLLIMPIERKIDKAQKLFDFCCFCYRYFRFVYLIGWNDAISYIKQIKNPFKWPNFCIGKNFFLYLLYLFVNIIVNRIEIRCPKIMDD